MVAQASGLSDAPMNRARWRGASSWATPSPRLNHPRLIARLSASSSGLRDETVPESSVEIACSVCMLTPFEWVPLCGYRLDASCKRRTIERREKHAGRIELNRRALVPPPGLQRAYEYRCRVYVAPSTK